MWLGQCSVILAIIGTNRYILKCLGYKTSENSEKCPCPCLVLLSSDKVNHCTSCTHASLNYLPESEAAIHWYISSEGYAAFWAQLWGSSFENERGLNWLDATLKLMQSVQIKAWLQLPLSTFTRTHLKCCTPGRAWWASGVTKTQQQFRESVLKKVLTLVPCAVNSFLWCPASKGI